MSQVISRSRAGELTMKFGSFDLNQQEALVQCENIYEEIRACLVIKISYKHCLCRDLDTTPT